MAANTTHDTKLYYMSGSTYTEILNVTSVSTPDYAVTDIESTVLTSDAKNFIPGIADGGKVTFTALHDGTNFTLLTGLRGTASHYKVLFNDSTGFTFPGYINKVAAKMDGPDKLLTLECEIKVTDDPTVL